MKTAVAVMGVVRSLTKVVSLTPTTATLPSSQASRSCTSRRGEGFLARAPVAWTTIRFGLLLPLWIADPVTEKTNPLIHVGARRC